MKNILIATSQNGELWTESVLSETEFSLLSVGRPIGLVFVPEENKFYAYFALQGDNWTIKYSSSTDGVVWDNPVTLYESISANYPDYSQGLFSHVFYYNGNVYIKGYNKLYKSSLSGINQSIITLPAPVGNYDDYGFIVAIHNSEIILITKDWGLYSSDGTNFVNKTTDWTSASYIDERFRSVYWSNELNCFLISHRYNDPSIYWSAENYIGTVVNGVLTNRYRIQDGVLVSDNSTAGDNFFFFYTNKNIPSFNTSYFYICDQNYSSQLKIKSNIYDPDQANTSTIELTYLRNMIFMDSYFLITNGTSVYKVNLDFNKNVISTKFVPDTLNLNMGIIDNAGILTLEPQLQINNITNSKLIRYISGEGGNEGYSVSLNMYIPADESYLYLDLYQNPQTGKFSLDKNRLPTNYNFKLSASIASLFFNQPLTYETSSFPGLRIIPSTIDLLSMVPDGSGYLDIIVRINNILDLAKEGYGDLTFYQNLFIYIDDVEFTYQYIDYTPEPNVDYSFYIYIGSSSITAGTHNIKFVMKDAYNPLFEETHSAVYQFTK